MPSNDYDEKPTLVGQPLTTPPAVKPEFTPFDQSAFQSRLQEVAERLSSSHLDHKSIETAPATPPSLGAPVSPQQVSPQPMMPFSPPGPIEAPKAAVVPPVVAGPIVVAAFLYFLTGSSQETFFPLKQGRYEIGKATDCDILIQEESASAHHGALRFDGRNWRITDFDSLNGTLLNGQRVGEEVNNPSPLQDNDRIVIGGTEIVFKCIRD